MTNKLSGIAGRNGERALPLGTRSESQNAHFRLPSPLRSMDDALENTILGNATSSPARRVGITMGRSRWMGLVRWIEHEFHLWYCY